jgi:isopenicillin N synthase-like dioxygenase
MKAAEEQARRVEAEAAAWRLPDLLSLEPATAEDLPILDLAALRAGEEDAIQDLAKQLMTVFEKTGFFMIANHGCEELVAATLAISKRFHTEVSQETKEEMAFGARGVGYLRINQRVLPKREKGNMNEAFIVKQEPGPRNISLASNPFPPESALPGFRQQVLACAAGLEELATSLLPVFATALRLPTDYFAEAFARPMYRMRLSHYPPAQPDSDQFGIAPHTDTSFFTLLGQDGQEGLVVASPSGHWTRVPSRPDLLVVNTGELLKQWSNDTVSSTPHFVVNFSDKPR